MKKELYFVTSNKNKLRECEQILGTKLKQIKIDCEEIQVVDVAKVVEHKTREAYRRIKKPIITEDTGLYFDDWNGLPGAFIKFFGERLDYKKIAKMIGKNRKAQVEVVIGYYDGKEYKSFKGKIDGSISHKPKGKEGFGFDVVFIPEGYTETIAELGMDIKNKIHARKLALDKLRRFLKNL